MIKMAHQEEEKEINERKEKLEKFLAFCLEDWINNQLLKRNEWVEIILLQKPEYNDFDRHFYVRGLIKIDRKHYPLRIEAGGIWITVKSKMFELDLNWEQLEEELKNCFGENA